MNGIYLQPVSPCYIGIGSQLKTLLFRYIVFQSHSVHSIQLNNIIKVRATINYVKPEYCAVLNFVPCGMARLGTINQLFSMT